MLNLVVAALRGRLLLLSLLVEWFVLTLINEILLVLQRSTCMSYIVCQPNNACEIFPVAYRHTYRTYHKHKQRNDIDNIHNTFQTLPTTWINLHTGLVRQKDVNNHYHHYHIIIYYGAARPKLSKHRTIVINGQI